MRKGLKLSMIPRTLQYVRLMEEGDGNPTPAVVEYGIDTLQTNWANPCWLLTDPATPPDRLDVVEALEGTVETLTYRKASEDDIRLITGLERDTDDDPGEDTPIVPIGNGWRLAGRLVGVRRLSDDEADPSRMFNLNQMLIIRDGTDIPDVERRLDAYELGRMDGYMDAWQDGYRHGRETGTDNPDGKDE